MTKFKNVSEDIYHAIEQILPWYELPIMPLTVAPIVLIDIHMMVRRETEDHIRELNNGV
jgi:hypothetical protein